VSGGFEVQPPCTLAEAIASEMRPPSIPRPGSSADIANEEEQAVRNGLIIVLIYKKITYTILQREVRPFLVFFSVLRQVKIVKPTRQPGEKTNEL
jgi:hypothetical protein